MKPVRRVVLLAIAMVMTLIPAIPGGADSHIFISELHYDNAGADVGEAIEVTAPAGMDMTGWSIVLYNGSSSQRSPYDTVALVGTVPAGGAFTVFISGIQNGAPDGVALVDSLGDVVEFISYEGSFTAASGPAAGLDSIDIGVFEPGDTAIGDSLQKIGGTWTGPTAATFAPELATAPPPPPPTDVFFSEIHYDNTGTDTGEAIEVTAPAGTDMAGWSIVLYNGSNGTVYNTTALEGVVTAAGAFTVFYPTNGIQNGSPDGLALVSPTGVVEFLSYEGSFTAVGGPADGMTSTDIGVEEPFFTPVGESLQRIAGVWSGPAPSTFAPALEIPLPACDPDAVVTLISAVQGPGSASPIEGANVTVEGSLTAVYPELGGIAVQEEPGDEDGDPASSEGVFAFLGFSYDFDRLDRFSVVQISGRVQERFGNTQIGFADLALCDGSVEIEPTPLNLPADFDAREALEGMLVETTQDLTVTSLFTAYRFGELGVSSSGILQQPTEIYEPGSPESFALEDQNADDLLFIDDRGEFGNANAPWFGLPDQRAGDIVEAGVQGVLYYSFGDHLLEPIEFPAVVDGDVVFDDREPAPSLEGGNDIGAFNVLNYFNTFGNDDVLRGARNQAEFDVQSAKIVDAILNLDASILGLIELENDYEDLYDGDDTTEPSIQTLVDQLNAAAGPDVYDWVRVPEELLTTEGLGGGGLGPDAIANGIIYQPAKVTMVGEAATFDIDALLGGEDPDNNRWPLAASFDVDGEVVTVMVNHFKSKGSTCDDTIVPAGFGDGQDDPQTGSCDLVREYAAERLIEWIETKPTGVNSPDTFVVGDLNSYAAEDPIRIFEDAGYENTVKSYDDGAFTYKFDGRYGSLDYIIASPSAKRLVDDAEVWQLNSPEPYGYLYFNEYIDLTAYASSDHDALVASISKPGKGPRK